MALQAGRKGVNSKNVDQYGNLIGGGGGQYELPIASPTTLGGVKPVSKTSDMTQSVGVDGSGGLFTEPGGSSYELPTASPTTLGGVKPVSKTSDMTQSVGVDGSGGLFTVPGSGGKFFYKDFALNSDNMKLTCENVGVEGYIPITASAWDVNSGYGAWVSLCIGYSGTNRYDVIGERRSTGGSYKARVYYVVSSMVEEMST